MRWLLVLGAEQRYEHTLDEAETLLLELGEVARLTGVQLTDAADGGPRRFRNCLMTLDCDLSRDAVRDALKRIERALGRGLGDGVPIDIDLLACAVADGPWMPDPHALAKHEFAAPHVRGLLDAAGVAGLPRE